MVYVQRATIGTKWQTKIPGEKVYKLKQKQVYKYSFYREKHTANRYLYSIY